MNSLIFVCTSTDIPDIQVSPNNGVTVRHVQNNIKGSKAFTENASNKMPSLLHVQEMSIIILIYNIYHCFTSKLPRTHSRVI